MTCEDLRHRGSFIAALATFVAMCVAAGSGTDNGHLCPATAQALSTSCQKELAADRVRTRAAKDREQVEGTFDRFAQAMEGNPRHVRSTLPRAHCPSTGSVRTQNDWHHNFPRRTAAKPTRRACAVV